jgi:hypothetical protein
LLNLYKQKRHDAGRVRTSTTPWLTLTQVETNEEQRPALLFPGQKVLLTFRIQRVGGIITF